MAAEYGYGKITTNGLEFLANAADKNSYIGSGSVWRDLSSVQAVGSLLNGPTFNSASGGSIIFSGSNSYASFNSVPYVATSNNGADPSPNQSYTIECWVYLNSVANTNLQYFISIESSYVYALNPGNPPDVSPYLQLLGSTGSGLFFSPTQPPLEFNLPTYTYNPSPNQLQINQWYHVVGVLDNENGFAYLYKNGVLIQNQTIVIGDYFQFNDRVYKISDSSFNYPLNGRIANAKVYNRILSATEVLQNFDAQKSRFGLQ